MLKKALSWLKKKEPVIESPLSYRDRRSMWIVIEMAQKKVRQDNQTKIKR